MAKESFNLMDIDGKHLNACWWIPENEPKAIVAIVHGLSDHIDRYHDFSQYLNSQGFAVVGMDYQGHGKSPGKRGHVKSYELLMSNVDSLLIEARLEFNDIPLFLFGQSFGGNIVANYTLRHKSKELVGVIISSPWLELAFSPPWQKMVISKIIGRVWPSLTASNDLDPMELSHDPWIGKSYFEDPLVHGKISAKLFNMAVKHGRWALEHAHLLNYPTLIMHGDDDRITSYKASIRFAERAGSLASIRIWEGLRHELHNEKNNEKIMQFICDWINQYIP